MEVASIMRALVDEAAALEKASLTQRVAWLQKLVDTLAVDADARLTSVLTDFRAAIGAVVAWGRGPRTPESLVELELVMRALVARGSAGLYALLARELRAMAAHDVDGAVCLLAADAAQAAADAVASGRPVEARHVEAMAALRERIGTNVPARL